MEDLTDEPSADVKVQVSGLDEEDDFVKERINEMVENTLSKIIRSVPVMKVNIHVETHKKEGNRKKYTVQGSFVTDIGSFHADDTEWDATKAMGLFLDKIEREAQRKLERERSY